MLKKMYMTDFNEPCLNDADPIIKKVLKNHAERDIKS